MKAGMRHPWVLRWIGLLLRGRHAGDATLAQADPALAALPAALALHSDSFAAGASLALRHAGRGVGGNLSPDLRWRALPPGASHWLLLVEDPDVPLPHAIVHALAWGPAAVNGLPEGALAPGRAPQGVVLERNGLGGAGYDGPRPLPGHGPHRYMFQLFALSAPPPPGLAMDALRPWLRAHALARGRLDGVFQRDWRARAVGAPA